MILNRWFSNLGFHLMGNQTLPIRKEPDSAKPFLKLISYLHDAAVNKEIIIDHC